MNNNTYIKTIKVGTFNVENLVLPTNKVYGNYTYSPNQFSRKKDWINSMLMQMGAQVVGFQEVFDKQALVEIIRENPFLKNSTVYTSDDKNNSSPKVALVSKFPVRKVSVYENFPTNAIIDFCPKDSAIVKLPFNKFSRPILKAEIQIDDFGYIDFYVVHLKSKRPIFYRDEDEKDPVCQAVAQARSLMLRASESVALRSILMQSIRKSTKPTIVCGDVNDIGNSVTSRIISGEVPQHKLSDSRKQEIWDVLLYHVKDIQARRSYQDMYYTHIHNGIYEALDHIMVSQELVTENPRNVGRVGLVRVFNDHLIDQTFTDEKHDRTTSDHGVVSCSIELKCRKK